MLDVEDTNDVVLDLAASDISATRNSSKSTAQGSYDIYELEIQQATDLAFLISFFFLKICILFRVFSRTQQKAGSLDLGTAAFATKIALDTVRRAEEDIIATAPDILAKPRSYQDIAMVIFHADALAKGDDVDEKTLLVRYIEDYWIRWIHLFLFSVVRSTS